MFTIPILLLLFTSALDRHLHTIPVDYIAPCFVGSGISFAALVLLTFSLFYKSMALGRGVFVLRTLSLVSFLPLLLR